MLRPLVNFFPGRMPPPMDLPLATVPVAAARSPENQPERYWRRRGSPRGRHGRSRRVPARLPRHLRDARHRARWARHSRRRRSRASVHAGLSLREGQSLPRAHVSRRAAHAPAASRRAKRRGTLRAHHAGTKRSTRSPRGSAQSRALPTDRRRSCPIRTRARWGSSRATTMDHRFFHLLGASMLDRTICSTAGAVGMRMTRRREHRRRPRGHARRAISCCSGARTRSRPIRTSGRSSCRRASAARAIIAIDPLRTRTADQCDEWIPIRPGTDAALALGMMHVLFAEHLEDADYLERYTLGASELRARAARVPAGSAWPRSPAFRRSASRRSRASTGARRRRSCA